jgi:hypothetical protein
MPKTRLIIPTAINVLTMVNGALLANLRRGTDATVDLPDLRTRARLILNETGVLPVIQEDEDTPVRVTR